MDPWEIFTDPEHSSYGHFIKVLKNELEQFFNGEKIYKISYTQEREGYFYASTFYTTDLIEIRIWILLSSNSHVREGNTE